MFEANGICYAGECVQGIRVTGAKALRGGMMLITFSTGEKRLFDSTLLMGSAFAPLKDEHVLADFTIFHGVMTWMNGEIDIAPETMYNMSYPYEGQESA